MCRGHNTLMIFNRSIHQNKNTFKTYRQNIFIHIFKNKLTNTYIIMKNVFLMNFYKEISQNVIIIKCPTLLFKLMIYHSFQN